MASARVHKQQWKLCKHLIIDEISMIDSELFDKIEAVARAVRNNNTPFGGIQLIVCGDFLQLPPVIKQDEKKKFCFQVRKTQRSYTIIYACLWCTLSVHAPTPDKLKNMSDHGGELSPPLEF